MSIAGLDYLFGPYRLSSTARRLHRDGLELRLSTRALELLLALVEGRGEMVSRDTLMERVWPDTRVHVNNLAVQMSALRRALGEGYITTVPGRGFRLAVPVVAEDGRVATATPARQHGNVPLLANRLIGRASAVAAGLETLAQTRLCSLVGPSGIGKTRLAQAMALSLQDGMADGAWLVDLASLGSGDTVASTVAATLGLAVGPGAVTAGTVAQQLKAYKLLLILDNCEHLLTAAATLAATVLETCPDVRILATSIERLGLPQERVHRIEPLSLPPAESEVTPIGLMSFAACELFVERAKALDHRFVVDGGNAPLIAEICRNLDGIPLAIELAAGRESILGLEKIRDELARRFRLLVGGQRFGAPRHQTLANAHAWSYGLLSLRAQRVLRLLSVFAGSFDLAAARALAATDAADTTMLEDLTLLVERSLVTSVSPAARSRYRLLESTKAYAAERLVEAGEAVAARCVHARYFTELFESAATAWELEPTRPWLARLLPDIDNLRAALRWSFEAEGERRIGQALCAASQRFWHGLCLVAEYRFWVERALPEPPSEDARLAARLALAEARSLLSVAVRLEASGRAETLARAVGDRATLGRALTIRAEALRRTHDWAGAGALLNEATALLQAEGAVKSGAEASQQLAIVCYHEGELARSRILNADALARYRATGHTVGILACLIRQANDDFGAGRVAEAIEATREALALSREERNRYMVELTQSNIATYEVARGNLAVAWQAGCEALPIAIEVDDRAGVAVIVQTLAGIVAAKGDAENAALLLGHSEAFYADDPEARAPEERASYDALVLKLEGVLDPSTFATCRQVGARWNDEVLLAAMSQLRPFG